MFDVTTMSAHELEAQRKLCQYLIDSTQAGKELKAVKKELKARKEIAKTKGANAPLAIYQAYLDGKRKTYKESGFAHMPHKHAIDGTMVDGPAISWTLTVSEPKLEPSTRVDWNWGI
tara:strand:- start:204 stop:554 length:351 start_codon:yes stop_codon:yes gene_type:complete